MKILARILIVFVCVCLLYTTAMYGYVWMKMRPLTPLTQPSAVASLATRPQLRMLHAVNSARRAQAKQQRYAGLEIDLNRLDGQLVAAHDATQFQKAHSLEDIFSALHHPEQKTFWIDLKIDLTQSDIDQIKSLARKYHIHPRRLLFEVSDGPTADLLNANGLPLLLKIPEGFDTDEKNPQKRATLNAQLEDLLRRYQPLAVAGSLGKYPYLKAYFPKYNKAIYYSNTVRPSLKKYFLARAIETDPTVLVWMQDEYTALPF